MGIKGAPALLKSFPIMTLEPKPEYTYIVDVLSVFYFLLLKNQNPQAFWTKVTRMIPATMNVLYVMDGQTPLAKATFVGQQRTKRRRDAYRNIQKSIHRWSGKKTRKWMYAKLEKWQEAVFSVSMELKNLLVEAGVAMGLNVIFARFEADLYIPHVSRSQPQAIVLTRDTDFLFHSGIHSIFLIRKRLSGKFMTPGDMAQILNLNVADLPLVAALCGNDYCANVRGIGIKGCAKVIAQLKRSSTNNMLLRFSQEMRRQGKRCDLAKHEVAYRIFANQECDGIAPRADDSRLYSKVTNLINNFKQAKQPNIRHPLNWLNPFRSNHRHIITSRTVDLSLPKNNEYPYPYDPDNPPPKPKEKEVREKDFDKKGASKANRVAKKRDAEAKKRGRRGSTKEADHLKATQPVITLQVGRLERNVYQTLYKNSKDKEDNVELAPKVRKENAKLEKLSRDVVSTLRTAVDCLNDAKIMAQLATRALLLEYGDAPLLEYIYISEGTKGGPSLKYARGKKRQDFLTLRELLIENRATNFVELDLDSLRNQEKNHLCALLAWDTLWGIDEVTATMPLKSASHQITFMARELDKDFSNLVIGSLPKLLKLRVELYIPDPPMPPNPSRICIFMRNNILLAVKDRWAVGPLSSSGGFVLFSEESVMRILWKVPGVEEFLTSKFEVQDQGGVKNFILNNHGILIKSLLWSPEAMSSQGHSRRLRSGKVVLSNTFQTNGFELNLSAFHQRKSKCESIPAMSEQNREFDYFLGMDPGERNTVGAVAIGHDNVIQEFLKSKRSFFEPREKFKRWLEEVKTDAVLQAEDLIQTNSWQIQDLRAYWNHTGIVQNFYSKRYDADSFKRRKWQLKRAYRREFDKATFTLLKMIKVKSSRQASKNKKKVVVIGDGEFNNDPSSLHQKFIHFFVSKCRGLNVPVEAIKEEFTSQTCPRCFEKAIKKTMRQTVCSACHMPFNRDTMAGHNMALIAKDTAQGNGRPKPFQFPKPPEATVDSVASTSN